MSVQILTTNFILLADSYKVGHYAQIPKGVKWAQSGVVGRRASKDKRVRKLVTTGLRYTALYLSRVRITEADVLEAEQETLDQGYEFNKEGWMEIVRRGGRLPLHMLGLKEGQVINPGVALVNLVNSVKGFAWLVSYVETFVQCLIWKFVTVASKARKALEYRMYWDALTGSAAGSQYGVHNFGDRGADSPEAAGFAGLSHALFFRGTDSLKTSRNIKLVYGMKQAKRMSSVDATEHSTMCMNSNAAERNDFGAAVMLVERLEEAVKRAARGVGIPLTSGVIDTYDSHRFVRDFLAGPELKPRIKNSGGKLVMRPDSGKPEVEPIDILDLAEDGFGDVTKNDKKFKVLPDYLGVLQGDGINLASMPIIFQACASRGWATQNLVLGMGGGLTHDDGRDYLSFSQKLTAISYADDAEDKEAWVNMKKEPITDMTKASLSGYIINILNNKGEVVSVNRLDVRDKVVERQDIVYLQDGEFMLEDEDFEEVCARANENLEPESGL